MNKAVDKKQLTKEIAALTKIIKFLRLIRREAKVTRSSWCGIVPYSSNIDEGLILLKKLKKRLTCQHIRVLEIDDTNHHTGEPWMITRCGDCDFELDRY